MITRFADLFKPELLQADAIEWPALFDEFSQKRPFLGSRHPGWSAAEFDPPRRALDNVRRIHALVLDYDNKTSSGDRVSDPITVDSVLEALGDYYGLVHTTRHHTRNWPRFRVILPLSRPVTRLEYTQLWLAAANRWPGLDPQPKDPSRFWYTPGVADHDGAEFLAITLCGAELDPDDFAQQRAIVLSSSSAPPTNLEARARAYVEKMPPSISGSGGHAALWAVARKLVADFGLDEQSAFRILQSEYNPRCQPPWTDKELTHKITQASKARTVNPISDRPMPNNGPLRNPPSEGTVPVVDGSGKDWMVNLRYTQGGKLTKDVGNAALILKNDTGFRGCLTYDAMACRPFWFRSPEYNIGLEPPETNSTLDDHHMVYVQQVLAKVFGLSVGKDIAWSAMEAAAHENEIHPVQDYLKALVWDGTPRLEAWLSRYMGAADNEYVRNVGRWWMISAVARAFRPGCQVDTVLILEGGQGLGKSQATKTLSDPWYLGALPDIRDRDRAADTIGGYWIVEIAELDALKGASMTRIKEFVSQQNDVYRKPYARTPIHRPRSCVFIGTTNESTYLTDPTGARRFWPVKVVNAIDRDSLARDRDQLWAEAKAMYEAGERWYPERTESEVIEEEQAARYLEDDWTDLVHSWIHHCNDAETIGFSIYEILAGALNIEPRMMDRISQMRMGAILTKLGYERRRMMMGGKRCYRYFKIEETSPSDRAGKN